MKLSFLCILALALASGACSRNGKQQAVSGAFSGVASAATLATERPPVEASVATEPGNPPEVGPAEVSPARASTNPDVFIPAGTRIRVRLGQSLDTRRSRAGERFVAYLDAPVVEGNRVILPRGTAFEGRVIEARPSGRLKGRAYLGVRLDSFRHHGRTYAIATAADIRASSSHKRRNIAIIGGGAGTGATVGAIAGGGLGAAVGAGAGAVVGTTSAFITGKKNVRLPVETPLVFSLRGGVDVGS
jgi:hypothetical protein